MRDARKPEGESLRTVMVVKMDEEQPGHEYVLSSGGTGWSYKSEYCTDKHVERVAKKCVTTCQYK